MLKEEPTFILKEIGHHPSQRSVRGECGFRSWTSVFSSDVDLKGYRPQVVPEARKDLFKRHAKIRNLEAY